MFMSFYVCRHVFLRKHASIQIRKSVNMYLYLQMRTIEAGLRDEIDTMRKREKDIREQHAVQLGQIHVEHESLVLSMRSSFAAQVLFFLSFKLSLRVFGYSGFQ